MTQPWRSRLLVACWLGAALRFHGLFANSFHADEALFATWARLIAVWRDPLLLTQMVDKPPLLFYLQALFYPFMGPVEWAARLPSFIASLLLIPLTARLTTRLTGDRTAGVIAAFVVAVAPLPVQMSATAFSDPLLTFWLMAALYAAPRRRQGGFRAAAVLPGVLFGLAAATKYQALLFLPLLLAVAALSGYRRAEWLGMLAGFAAVVCLGLAWQWARQGAGQPIGLQWGNIGGIRPAYSWELRPRLEQTTRLWLLSAGWPIAAVALAGSGIALMAARGKGRPPAAEWAIGLFLFAYVALHWLWAVPVWDRYLLPVFPLAALLIGRVISGAYAAIAARPRMRQWATLALALFAVACLPVAGSARAGHFPIGGQPGADGGARDAATLLKDAPYGTVLYDHWYSWQWRYQLFDGRVYVSWFPHADALLDDLSAFGRSGAARYIAFPSSAAANPVIRRLTEQGYELERLDGQDSAAGMTLFRIIMPEESG